MINYHKINFNLYDISRSCIIKNYIIYAWFFFFFKFYLSMNKKHISEFWWKIILPYNQTKIIITNSIISIFPRYNFVLKIDNFDEKLFRHFIFHRNIRFQFYNIMLHLRHFQYISIIINYRKNRAPVWCLTIFHGHQESCVSLSEKLVHHQNL